MPLPIVGKAHQAAAAAAPFTWFIYGSSLDAQAFAAWAEEHGYRMPDLATAVPARLNGYRLCFDVQSRFWGGTVASLVEERGAFVEGLALPLPGEARGLVDHKEGAISGLYEPFIVDLAPTAGGPLIRVLAYKARDERRLPGEQPPSPSFLDVLIRGARTAGLSTEYVATLEARRA